jgi:hypothetical protein
MSPGGYGNNSAIESERAVIILVTARIIDSAPAVPRP